MPEGATPVRKQYLEIKREYPGTLLFFRLGDFYETFDEDAEITARELDIVLTSRPVGKGVRAPLAGIPYHAVDNYLARLIQKGYHVAICEQIGQEPVNGIFPRRVVRVVTAGTVIEPALLPGDGNNYLAAVVLSDDASAAIAYTDVTTGDFAVTELPGDAVETELARLRPAEIIQPEGQSLSAPASGNLTAWPRWHFEPGKCEEVLLTHFKAAALDGFGIQGRPLAIQAAGAILQYLEVTQPDALHLLSGLRMYSLGAFMTLDASTRRNLELEQTLRGEREGSLLGLLDRTVTPMGRRLIQQWISQPLLHADNIRSRQDSIQFFVERGMLRAELRAALKPVTDLERLVNRIVATHARPRDLVALRETLQLLPELGKLLDGASQPTGPDVTRASGAAGSLDKLSSFLPIGDLGPFEKELDLLHRAIEDDPPATLQGTGIVRAGFSEELDAIVSASQHARDWIANLEATERTRTGIKSLKVGYNKVFGYYIEISRGAAAKAPENYIRKQTLVNGERFITPEMKEYETLVLNAAENIHEIELRLFKEICASLAKSAARLLRAARAVAELDVYSALAEVAAVSGYVRPEITQDGTLEIRGGRHPVVERSLQRDRYVPNDAVFDDGEIVQDHHRPQYGGKIHLPPSGGPDRPPCPDGLVCAG